MTIEYKIIQLPANTVLFEEDSKGEAAFLLRSGRIELSKHINGHRRILSILKAPIMFGEMALIMKDQRRTASARALEDCELVEVNRHAFQSFLKDSPQMMQTTLELLVQRLKNCTARVLHIPDTDQAILRSLSLLNEHKVSCIDYTLFVQETASMLMQPINRIENTLNKLIQAGVLDKRKSQFKGTELVITQNQFFLNKAKEALINKKETLEVDCSNDNHTDD